MTVAGVFKALGDPVRLEMVRRLVKASPCTIGAVSQDLGITRQGARKHLDVLARANIVRLEPRGRDVLVHLERDAFDSASSYIAELERRWDMRLQALKQFLESPDEQGKAG
jgi:DNA-binding transcriptional ArsR family regulator